MAVPILTLDPLDTAYINKHNVNYASIKNAIETIQASMGNTTQANLTAPLGFEAAFGNGVALIGVVSYAQSTAGTEMTITSGYAWIKTIRAVVNKTTSTVLAFVGRAAATYYVHLDSAGVPFIDTTNTDTLYSVVWSGTAFGTITRVATIVWGASDWIASQTSAALGATYTTLDARLEAGEALASTGSVGGTIIKGKLTKSVAGGVTVVLTATEATAIYVELTGALTADINVTFPLASVPRIVNIKNSTTGAFELTCKGSAGTGKMIPQGHSTFLNHDGTNMGAAMSDADIVAKVVPYAAIINLDWTKYDVVHITLTGNATINQAGAVPGQKVMIILKQDVTGGRVITWGAEVKYGADVATIPLSSGPSLTDEVGFSYDWIATKYNVVSVARGY